MKVSVFDDKTKLNDLTLSKKWDDASQKVMHQVVVARLANGRAGLAHTKTRSEAHGGGKKPWKQKGLGRARCGTIRSPLWKGGGVTFGPRKRSFNQKINKKQKVVAYMHAFAKLNSSNMLKVIDQFNVGSHKTKDFLATLSKYLESTEGRVVVIVKDYDKELLRGSHNIPNVRLLSVDTIDILPIVYAKQVLVTEEAMKSLDEKFTRVLS